jgi:hypothetical protein
MATKFSVHDIHVDEETLSRKSTVRLGSSGDVKFQTPTKAGVDGVIDLSVYEAYRKIKPLTIRKCLESEAYDRKNGLDLKSRVKGGFNILTMEYDDKNEVPTEEMIFALSDMQYNFTDVITTPSWFELISKKDNVNTDLYIKLSGIYLDAASVRNHKPVIGTIPQSIPPERLRDVVKFYIDKNVTSFMIDSHGRTLISGMWIRTLNRSLGEYDIEKESILYSINAFQGIVRKNESSIEAKDFIGFAEGIDIIGGKHANKFFGQSKTDENTRTFARMFDPLTYNYEKMQCSFDKKKEINEQSVRIQDEEFSKVRDVIMDGKVKNLLEKKRISKETLNSILSSKGPKHTILDDFI